MVVLLAGLTACGGRTTVTVVETQTVTVTAPSATTDTLPPIVVESPLPNETVRSPLHATGTANTFEATFNYDLLAADGKLLSHHFETATSGSGTRGTFDFSVPFQVDRAQTGTFVVYEISAADGKRIHEVRIPIRLEP
jgi:germination protein M